MRQSIVVLMGTLAQHMDKNNPKVSGWSSCFLLHVLTKAIVLKRNACMERYI